MGGGGGREGVKEGDRERGSEGGRQGERQTYKGNSTTILLYTHISHSLFSHHQIYTVRNTTIV